MALNATSNDADSTTSQGSPSHFFYKPFHAGIPPEVQPEIPMAHFEAISSYSVTGYLGEKPDLHPATIFFQGVVG